MYRRSLIVLGGAAAMTLVAGPAGAHAIVVESMPAANATVSGPDLAVRIRFNSRIDVKRSRLQLVPPAGKARPLEILPSERPDELTARVANLAVGAYKLRWQVLAVDGHVTRGDIAFHVAGA